ncbi:MAG: GNAT family N-acetyltransferase [Coriobacteriia bacterium]|nr:GNAT family N-acetyltransferase [Coriobacteriia bacterium]
MSTRIEMLHEVRDEDLLRAAATLARAFEHDPVWARAFEGVPRETMAAWFEGPIRYCREFGRVYATSERLEGIAGVVPGEYARMTMRRAMRAGTMKMAPRMGLQLMMRAPRMMRMFAPLDSDRKRHMGARAFTYVMIVGVDPEHQRQGHGGALLRALMEESDRMGIPLYLETETEENRQMYEHYGFDLLSEIALPVVGLPMWEMLREPALSR